MVETDLKEGTYLAMGNSGTYYPLTSCVLIYQLPNTTMKIMPKGSLLYSSNGNYRTRGHFYPHSINHLYRRNRNKKEYAVWEMGEEERTPYVFLAY